MKRILFFLLLLVNLQLTTDNGSLSIEFGEVSAQRVMESQLGKTVQSAKAVTRGANDYYCSDCNTFYSEEMYFFHLPCPMAKVKCYWCGTEMTNYELHHIHTCDLQCANCHKSIDECTCDLGGGIGKYKDKNGGSSGSFLDDDDDFGDFGGYGVISNTPTWNYKKAIEWLKKNAHSWNEYNNLPKKEKGNCAKYLRTALEKAGINTKGHPTDAKDYGQLLQKNGFKEISPNGYVPKEGDIRVWQPAPGTRPEGHIHMYDGDQWVSDFKEPNLDGPNKHYRKNPNYKIYRK